MDLYRLLFSIFFAYLFHANMPTDIQYTPLYPRVKNSNTFCWLITVIVVMSFYTYGLSLLDNRSTNDR